MTNESNFLWSVQNTFTYLTPHTKELLNNKISNWYDQVIHDEKTYDVMGISVPSLVLAVAEKGFNNHDYPELMQRAIDYSKECDAFIEVLEGNTDRHSSKEYYSNKLNEILGYVVETD